MKRLAAALALALLATCIGGEWAKAERTFADLGFPTRTYTCISEDRELVAELSIPFQMPGRPVRASLGIHASSQFAPTLQLWVNGAVVPGPWNSGPNRYRVRSSFNEQWDLSAYTYNLREGENSVKLRIEQRLGYCEYLTLFENSFVTVWYEMEPTPSAAPSQAHLPPASQVPPRPSQPAAAPEASPFPAAPAPTATAAAQRPQARLDVGAPCGSGDECMTGNCNVVCCIAGFRCCLRDAHCRPDEVCDSARSYCVPRAGSGGGSSARDGSDILATLFGTRNVIETGLFFAALIVGVYYFSRQRDE